MKTWTPADVWFAILGILSLFVFLFVGVKVGLAYLQQRGNK